MLEITDLKIWFIIAVITFVLGITFIIIIVKLMSKKFEEIATNDKKNNRDF